MKKPLVDLNVILDFLNHRNFHEFAAEILNRCANEELDGYICAHEITTLAYFLMKDYRDSAKVNNILATILDIFTVVPVDKTVLYDALNSPITDYEDAVIEVSALRHGIDCIITRNIKDFKSARIPCFTPEQFLNGKK
jgi:predicted nucleic acid-binding protein